MFLGNLPSAASSVLTNVAGYVATNSVSWTTLAALAVTFWAHPIGGAEVPLKMDLLPDGSLAEPTAPEASLPERANHNAAEPAVFEKFPSPFQLDQESLYAGARLFLQNKPVLHGLCVPLCALFRVLSNAEMLELIAALQQADLKLFSPKQRVLVSWMLKSIEGTPKITLIPTAFSSPITLTLRDGTVFHTDTATELENYLTDQVYNEAKLKYWTADWTIKKQGEISLYSTLKSYPPGFYDVDIRAPQKTNGHRIVLEVTEDGDLRFLDPNFGVSSELNWRYTKYPECAITAFGPTAAAIPFITETAITIRALVVAARHRDFDTILSQVKLHPELLTKAHLQDASLVRAVMVNFKSLESLNQLIELGVDVNQKINAPSGLSTLLIEAIGNQMPFPIIQRIFELSTPKTREFIVTPKDRNGKGFSALDLALHLNNVKAITLFAQKNAAHPPVTATAETPFKDEHVKPVKRRARPSAAPSR